MAEVHPEPPPASPAPDTATAGQSIVSSTAAFLSVAVREWLPSLVDQPMTPPFCYDARFDGEAGRISRLLAIVVLLSSILLGGLNLLAAKAKVSDSIKWSLMVFVVSVVLGILYKPFTLLCRVKVYPPPGADAAVATAVSKSLSTRQIVFSVLYTLVPWLPLFAFARASVSALEGGSLLILALYAPFIFIVYIFINFAKSIRLITNCYWYRIWLSLFLPVVLLLGYILIL